MTFNIHVKVNGKEQQVDQEQQRDLKEEAANRALLHEDDEPEQPTEADEPENNHGLDAQLVDLNAGVEGCSQYKSIRVFDKMTSEVEFFLEPEDWPSLRKKIDAAYEEYLGKRDLEEAFDNVQAELDKTLRTCSHPMFGDGRCAEMSCHNYYGKLPDNNWTPGNYQL